MPGFVGIPELMLLGLVALLFFGPKRLPEMGRSLGKGLREFKSSVTNDHDKDLEIAEVPARTPEAIDLTHLNGDALATDPRPFHGDKERAA
jgi:sec-independent protein translocase protein TatA